jgi:hypothetical protein
MIDLFRDPVWQGIGVVVAILLTFLGFYVAQRRKVWIYLSGLIVFLLTGMWIGTILEQKKSSATSHPTAKSQTLTPIQKIDFDFQDSLINHGWVFTDASEPPVVIEHITNSYVGSAINISSTVKYGLDFNISPAAAQLGNMIEFVADLRKDAAVYAFVVLKRDDGTTTTGWLKIQQAEGQTLPSAVITGTGSGNDEWLVYVTPNLYRGDNWLLFQVDLQNAVNDTFGKDGWSYSALRKLRLRGNMSLDYITVFQTSP